MIHILCLLMHYVTDKGVNETGRTGSSEEQEINSKIREEQGKDEFIIKTIELLKIDPDTMKYDNRRN